MLAEIEAEHHRLVASLHQGFPWQDSAVGRGNALQRGRQPAVSLAEFCPTAGFDRGRVCSLQLYSRAAGMPKLDSSTLTVLWTVLPVVFQTRPYSVWESSKESSPQTSFKSLDILV